MNRPPARYACAAALLATTCAPAAAQTITTTGIAGVPMGGAFALGALALLLTVLAARSLPRGARMALLLAAVALAGSQWGGQPLLAQVLARFTQPGGETLPIPVTPVANGFEPAHFENASGRDLHVAAIAPPGFAACFPGGVAPVLPPPVSGGPADCAAGQPLAAGATCQVNVDAICKALAAQAVANISMVTPSTLNFSVNDSASVVVTNAAGSPVAAQNVAAQIPGGSNLVVATTTCGATLAPGASCTFTFTAATPGGPTAVMISGDNSNTVAVSLTVAPAPTIAITGPVQPSRVIAVGDSTPLALEVTNNGAVTATGITVSDKSAAPDVVVDASGCASVAPGTSCTLLLTSSTPYAPATVTIAGSNTANSPGTLVAFSHLGGLVFEAGGGGGKVVGTTDPLPGSWIGAFADIPGADSASDGAANTSAIVANASCTGNPARCAAQQCRATGADWYLPASDELVAAVAALCSNSATPCDFGNFQNSYYWTSQQLGIADARTIQAPSGGLGDAAKIESRRYRCVRAFTN
ncbi:midcut-by-XrtH protein [Pulveribacter sp.]|uniref:midcut-by-XrtH protein n=1 Tax=Pulveribacter sp. TaxID=2678893 RepID=UPI0028A2D5CA|nr:midcut-by-XrtH protein [Pulveribacter sp.]